MAVILSTPAVSSISVYNLVSDNCRSVERKGFVANILSVQLEL